MFSCRDKAQTALLSTVLAAGCLLVVWIRRSRFGRILLAMRESEAACTTLGLKLRTAKLAVFALSAGIAGVGGALLGGVYESATPSYFEFFGGLQVLLLAVVGGIGAVGGVGLALVFMTLTEWVSRTHPGARDLINCLPGLAGIGLARNPGGVASDIAGAVAGLRSKLRQRSSADGGEGREVPLELIGIARSVTAADIASLDRALGRPAVDA